MKTLSLKQLNVLAQCVEMAKGWRGATNPRARADFDTFIAEATEALDQVRRDRDLLRTPGRPRITYEQPGNELVGLDPSDA